MSVFPLQTKAHLCAKKNGIKHLLLSAFLFGLSCLTTERAGGQTFTTLYSFTGNSDGAQPHSSLVLMGNTLYGTTPGGSANSGTVFALTTNGTSFRVLHSFTGKDGAMPYAPLLLSSDTLYGTTTAGGASGNGAIFALNTNGMGFKVLYSFTQPSGSSGFLGFPVNNDGAAPFGGLTLLGDTLYGTTTRGGMTSGQGTVFALNTNGTGFRTLHSFTVASDGGGPTAGLMISSNLLYGTTEGSDAYNGTVFVVKNDGSSFRTLHYFSGGSDGAWPYAGVVLSGGTLFGAAMGATGLGPNAYSTQGEVFKVNIDGTGFTNLHLFTPTPALTNVDGDSPASTLVLAGDTLFGTASLGGAGGGGTLFAVKTNGTGFTTLYNFGGNPNAGLILLGNTLFGTTLGGGSFGHGSVFSFSLTPVKPVITQQPLSRTNIAGSIASFSVVAAGPAPLSYEWLKGTNSMPKHGDSTLILTNVSDADAALYSVIVSNAAGKVTSTPATLTVLDPPLITRQPFSGTNIAGNAATLSVAATGTPPLAYQWWKGPSPLLQQRNSTLTLTNVSDADAASYSVVVTNAAGKATSASAKLTVIDRLNVTISSSGKNVILTWPNNFTGFNLQSSTTLSPPIWTTNNLAAPVVINGQNTITNPISGTQQFFRLVQ